MINDLPSIDLTGFEPPFALGEYEWGPAVTHDGAAWKDHAFHVETLALFDHDYLGTHMFVQVWDYRQQEDPEQRWQHMLLLHHPGEAGWGWTIRREYEAREDHRAPSYADVGADVDLWLGAPEYLRFILE